MSKHLRSNKIVRLLFSLRWPSHRLGQPVVGAVVAVMSENVAVENGFEHFHEQDLIGELVALLFSQPLRLLDHLVQEVCHHGSLLSLQLGTPHPCEDEGVVLAMVPHDVEDEVSGVGLELEDGGGLTLGGAGVEITGVELSNKGIGEGKETPRSRLQS